MAEYHGGCSCGEVRFKVLKEPMFSHACHCHLCQKATSSAFIIHHMIEKTYFIITEGETSDFKGPSGSDRNHRVKRCASCGYAIVSYWEGNGMAVAKGGALDEPDQLRPRAHIFVERKLHWVGLPEDVPQYQRMYDRHEAWPQESLDRFLLAQKNA